MFPQRLFPSQCFGRCSQYIQQSSRISKTNNASKLQQSRLVITRSKQTNSKKAAISRAINKNQKAEGDNLLPADNIFGMRPIDYTIRPPICNSPPPPPPRPGMRKYIFPMSLVIFAGITGYFYVNNKNDNIEFWLAMQNGEAVDVDDDDDEEDDEDE